MIKLVTHLNISVNDITDISNPSINQLVINRPKYVIKRYTRTGWTNFKIYSKEEFENIVSNIINLQKGKLLDKVDIENGKGLVDIDFSDNYFRKLNGIDYGANRYEHPIEDKHITRELLDLFNGYRDRITEIERTKFSSVSFDKSANMVDFKGSNNEIICSILLNNVHLLETMMMTINNIEEILNRILLQDLPDINNDINKYLERLHKLKDLFADMYDRIRKAEARLKIEREPNPLRENVEKIIEKRTVSK